MRKPSVRPPLDHTAQGPGGKGVEAAFVRLTETLPQGDQVG
ncbi:hypothetical protein [Streptomyces albogriseolus]